MMGIYEIINLQDGRATSYVGSSVNIKGRWGEHVRTLRKNQHSNFHLQAAWNKYGEGAFSFCVLEQVKDTRDLLKREQYFLDCAFEVGDTYNIAQNAGMPTLGRERSEEERHNISAALTGRKLSKEHKCKLSVAMMGHEISQEARRKIGEAHIGKVVSEETRRKIGDAGRRRICSGETRRKLAAAAIKPYPAFIHRESGERIPAGVDLTRLCRERNLNRGNMGLVVHGQRNHHKGWTLANNMEE